MTRVLPPLQTCFQFIFLFIYLCIFIHLPPRRRRRRPRRRCHTHKLRLEKTLRLGRNCLLRSRYIGCEAPSFLPGVLHRHSQFNTSKVIETFEAHPTLATPARYRSCRHFSFPRRTPYVNVKLSGACAELKITYQLYGLSIRNPIRKVRIAEPLYCLSLSSSSFLFKPIPNTDNADSKNQQKKVPSYQNHEDESRVACAGIRVGIFILRALFFVFARAKGLLIEPERETEQIIIVPLLKFSSRSAPLQYFATSVTHPPTLGWTLLIVCLLSGARIGLPGFGEKQRKRKWPRTDAIALSRSHLRSEVVWCNVDLHVQLLHMLKRRMRQCRNTRFPVISWRAKVLDLHLPVGRNWAAVAPITRSFAREKAIWFLGGEIDDRRWLLSGVLAGRRASWKRGK